MRKFFAAACLLATAYTASSQQVARSLTAANGQFVGFYEFKPYDYNPAKKYPVIIFMHGIGERGNGTTELYWLTWHAIPRMINQGATMTYTNPNTGQKESFIVLSPQLSKSYSWWQGFYIDEMLKYARSNFNIDENRIYLTGLSAGGGATWSYPNASYANASNFAAIAPVCGTCDWNYNLLPSTIVAAKVAVWAFHAQDDYTVGVNCTNWAIDGINGMSPTAEAKKTIYPGGGHYIWETVYEYSGVFEWFLSKSRSGTTVTPNTLPVAKAGNDLSITLPASTVTLNNAGSYDSDGSISTYQWSYVSGPAQPTFGSAGAASTQVSNLKSGTYVFRLTVTDNRGGTGTDDVSVVVNPAPNTTGQPPVANAGVDQTLPANQATVLNGEKSSAAAGIASYKWTKFSGPDKFELLTPDSYGTWVRNLVDGIYVFRLTVTDYNGLTAFDDVVFTVGNGGTTPTPTPPPVVTQPPVANAGPDQKLPAGQATVLNGDKSTAPAGIKTYKWTKFSGPDKFEMLTPDTYGTWVRNLVDGIYVFRLTITDNNGVTASDDVTFTVGTGAATTPPATTTPSTGTPVANAGADQTLPAGQATVLNGEKSTAPAGIKTYKWTKHSGPDKFEMLTPDSYGTWVRNLVDGIYVFRLTVTDNNGVTATDDVTFNVGTGVSTASPAPSPSAGAPVANAGKDETLPAGQATVLNGEKSTAPAGIKSYLWTKVSGPAPFEMLTPTSYGTWVRYLAAGTYVFRLTITDNNGVTASDDVVLTTYAVSGTGASGLQLSAADPIGELNAAKATIFPNPVADQLNLRWNSDYKGVARLNILDVTGRVIQTESVRKEQQLYNNSLQTKGLRPGVYFLQIQTHDGKKMTQRFLKK